MSGKTPDYAEMFLRGDYESIDQFVEDVVVSSSLVAPSAPQTINKAPTPKPLAKKMGLKPKAPLAPKVVKLRPVVNGTEEEDDELFPKKKAVNESSKKDDTDIEWTFAKVPNMSPIPTLTMHAPVRQSVAESKGFGYMEDDDELVTSPSPVREHVRDTSFLSGLEAAAIEAQKDVAVSADGVVLSWDNLPIK